MNPESLKSHKQIKISLIKKLSIILVGMIVVFAMLFWILGLLETDSLNGIYLDKKPAEFQEALYFSVVTITTLGYGDFTPSGVSRLLAVVEAVAGLFFAGYSISQVLSVKQDASIEYLLKAQIVQNYTGLLEGVRDAKEAVTDYHRINRRGKSIDYSHLNLYHAHPLYSSVIALQKLNGYTQHIKEIGMIDDMEVYLNRAATRVEELSSLIRKFVNYMDSIDQGWKTTQSKKAVKDIIRCLENHLIYMQHSKYNNTDYKGQAKYDVVLSKVISDLRRLMP